MEEKELTTSELIQEFVENRDGRYVLIGTPEKVADGHALIYDTVTRMVSWIDENDSLHRDTAKKMLAAGAHVLRKIPGR